MSGFYNFELQALWEGAPPSTCCTHRGGWQCREHHESGRQMPGCWGGLIPLRKRLVFPWGAWCEMRTMDCGALALHTGGLFLFRSPRRLHDSGVWLQVGLVSRCVAEKSDRRHTGTIAVHTNCQNWCWKCFRHHMPHPCLPGAAAGYGENLQEGSPAEGFGLGPCLCRMYAAEEAKRPLSLGSLFHSTLPYHATPFSMPGPCRSNDHRQFHRCRGISSREDPLSWRRDGAPQGEGLAPDNF